MKKLKLRLALVTTGFFALIVPFLITTLTVVPVALTGCTTSSGGTTNNNVAIQAAATIIQNTAYDGAIIALTPPQGETNNAVYFQAANQAIGLFLTGNDYSPATFQADLVAINVPGATNVWVQLAIGAVVDLYQVYYSQYVEGQVNGNYAAQAILTGVQNGINQALGQPLIPAPVPPASLSAHSSGCAPAFSGQVLPRPIKK
jgi:hypothetical protein